MDNKNVFVYNYSAARNKEIESIRKKYMPKEKSELDILRSLDSEVEGAGRLCSLCLGIFGTLVFGVGLCLGLGVIGESLLGAVLLSILGVAFMLPAYPLFKYVSKKKRAALTPRIIELSDEILKNTKI